MSHRRSPFEGLVRLLFAALGAALAIFVLSSLSERTSEPIDIDAFVE
ncbi:MAG: hypothetical protein Q7W30_09855 [Coriobacteriia bacterium]|nr:hypothetical protein [Coriobacteriia bacterium]